MVDIVTYVLNGLVDFLHTGLASFGVGWRIGIILDLFLRDLDLVSVKLHIVDLHQAKEEQLEVVLTKKVGISPTKQKVLGRDLRRQR